MEITRSEDLCEIREDADLEVRFGGNLLCRLEEDKSLVSAVINSCLGEDSVGATASCNGVPDCNTSAKVTSLSLSF